MHRIIEQTAVSCGMVKTPNPSSHKETAAHGEYRYSSRRTQGPHLSNEARKQTQPQVADAHRPARMRWSLTNRDRPDPLLLAHHRLLRLRALHARRASGLRRSQEARPRPAGGRFGARADRRAHRRGSAHQAWLAALALWSCTDCWPWSCSRSGPWW
jgi:hypothetical protein